MSQAAIEIVNLHKAYREGMFARTVHGAVQGINLRIAPGESWALVGPNGAGKTTTLHCLMGLMLPDQGRLEIFSQSPQIPATRARVGFQSEIFYSYPHLSAYACLKFYGQLSGLVGQNLDERIHSMLARVGLAQAGHKRMGSFSKGMVQRLGLAQSLLHDPDVIIWDEPASGLDPEGRRWVVDVLNALKKDSKTVLFSTHVLPDIERTCDHVAMIVAGKILVQGSIATLCAAQGKSLEDLYISTMREHGHAT